MEVFFNDKNKLRMFWENNLVTLVKKIFICVVQFSSSSKYFLTSSDNVEICVAYFLHFAVRMLQTSFAYCVRKKCRWERHIHVHEVSESRLLGTTSHWLINCILLIYLPVDPKDCCIIWYVPLIFILNKNNIYLS